MKSFPDISHWQSIITKDANPDRVAMKATEGLYYKDPTLQLHQERFAGIPQTYYHYYRPSWTGKAQAEFFVKTLAGSKAKTPEFLVLDFEELGASLGGIADSLKSFCLTTELLTGIRPVIYTRRSLIYPFLFFHRGRIAWMKEYKSWIAAYPWEKRKDFIQNFDAYKTMAEEQTPIFQPRPFYPFDKIMWWQWTGHGRFTGIGGDVDLNVELN
jgi:GH25 family lysozyme M1 (1,4-beta-N-acetylmuramidase)